MPKNSKRRGPVKAEQCVNVRQETSALRLVGRLRRGGAAEVVSGFRMDCSFLTACL